MRLPAVESQQRGEIEMPLGPARESRALGRQVVRFWSKLNVDSLEAAVSSSENALVKSRRSSSALLWQSSTGRCPPAIKISTPGVAPWSPKEPSSGHKRHQQKEIATSCQMRHSTKVHRSHWQALLRSVTTRPLCEPAVIDGRESLLIAKSPIRPFPLARPAQLPLLHIRPAAASLH